MLSTKKIDFSSTTANGDYHWTTHSNLIPLDGPGHTLLQIGGETSDFQSCTQVVKWQWQDNRLMVSSPSSDAMLPSLDGHVSCQIGDGVVMVTGGWNAGNKMRLIRVECATGAQSDVRWSLVNTSGSSEKDVPRSRVRHSAVFDRVRQRVLIFGGRLIGPVSSEPEYSADVFAFDLKTNTWQRIRGHDDDDIDSVDSVPMARCGHSAVMDERHERMLVFGGMSIHDDTGKNGRYFDDLYVFNTNSDTWSRIEIDVNGPRPAPRERHAALMWKGHQMLVMGGWTRGRCVTDDQAIMEFDTESNTWKHLETTTTMSRFGHCAAVVDGDKIVVVGGRNNGFSIEKNLFICSVNNEKCMDIEVHMDVVSGNAMPVENEQHVEDEREDEQIPVDEEAVTEVAIEPAPAKTDIAHDATTSSSSTGAIAERLQDKKRGIMLPLVRKATLKRPQRSAAAKTLTKRSLKQMFGQVKNDNAFDVPDPDTAVDNYSVSVQNNNQDPTPTEALPPRKNPPLGGVSMFGGGGINMSDILSAGKKLKKSSVAENQSNQSSTSPTEKHDTNEAVPPKKQRPIGGVAMPGLPNMSDILSVKLKKTNPKS